jgi:UDP:flavonoid glycosyltransferase YjiC (YdhE family)
MVARGHDVLWALPPDGVGHVERAGLRAVPIGTPGLTQPADIRRRYPELESLAPADRLDILFGKIFGVIAAPVLLADLAPLAHEWRPDLVVADAGEFAGHIVAAELGVPSVTKGFGPLLPERRVANAGDDVAPLWRSRGLEPRPYGGSYDHLYLDIYPPVLQAPSADHLPRRQLLRPVIYDGLVDASSPVPLPDGPADAPLVYVTMGTVFNQDDLVRAVIGALAPLGARVLVTVGSHADPAALGDHGPRVRVERYVPQSLVLPHCALVVSHAGSGTVVAALTRGLPQLCLPQGADQFLNAAAVAGAGAGISLLPGEATPAAVAGAVARLLADGSFADAARRVSESIASMPSPDDVAVILETLAR